MNALNVIGDWFGSLRTPRMTVLFQPSEETSDVRWREVERLNSTLATLRKNLEEEIGKRHESEHRALALAEAGTCPVVIHRDDQVLVVNRLFTEMTGLNEECLRQTPELFWSIFLEPSREKMKERIDSGNLESYMAKLQSVEGIIHKVWIDPILVPYNGHGLCRAERIHDWKERNV